MDKSGYENKFKTAVILAGGKSTRMGFDKQLIKIDDRYLMEILVEELSQVFEEIIIISNDHSPYKGMTFNCDVVVKEDVISEKGPLGGLYSALYHAHSEYVFLIACDMPYMNLEYIDYLKTALGRVLLQDASLSEKEKPYGIVSRKGPWLEPFFAFYSRALIKDIKVQIDQNQLRIVPLFEKHKILYVEEAVSRSYSRELLMFENLNTIDDIKRYEASRAYIA